MKSFIIVIFSYAASSYDLFCSIAFYLSQIQGIRSFGYFLKLIKLSDDNDFGM